VLKKSFILIFAFLYFIVSSGFIINTHFCGGKLKAVSLFNQTEKGCCGSKKASKGCCHDSKSFIKVKDVQESNSNSVLTSKQIKIADFNSLVYNILSVVYSDCKTDTISKKIPDLPFLYKPQIFIELHSLLI
jgi:hypothetical protein